MLHRQTLSFLKSLGKNNNRAWFDAHREQYEEAKTDFIGFVERLLIELGKFDPSIRSLTAKECVFRINRDVRFSKNKAPYKTNLAASICSLGRKANYPGYYFHCEPGRSFIAGGLYMPDAKDLKKIRQELDYNFDDWKRLLSNTAFKKQFPEGLETSFQLTRPPKGYDEDNPAIDFLKMKGYIVSKKIDDKSLGEKSLLTQTIHAFKTMKPVIDFLKQGLDS